jgi:hypothetical protein
MKAFFTGFWGGFLEKTNAVHVDFFTSLLSKVYGEEVTVGDFESSSLLVENTQVASSLKNAKKWHHTYLFSGESYIRADRADYDCVLYGERSAGNTINCPLYVPFTFCLNRSSFPEPPSAVPPKEVVVCISNAGGAVRNEFLEALEKCMHVTYIGHYKNNIGGPLSAPYNSQEYFDYISQFKFAITMENSEHDTYITEKLVNGFHGRTIPVYWGSPRVHDYFNKSRFLCISNNESSIDEVINQMKSMRNDEWLRHISGPVYTEFGESYNIDAIADEIKNMILPRTYKSVNKIYFICSPEFEPVRFEKLQTMCSTLGLAKHNVKFICPSWKSNVTLSTMLKHVRTQYVQRVRHAPMKRAEISLFLNWIAVLKDIERSYSDGTFLCFESDVFPLENARDFEVCAAALASQRDKWSIVHVGGDRVDGTESCGAFVELPYRHSVDEHKYRAEAREDLSSPSDSVRFFRHFNTRCTDSLFFSYKGVKQFLKHLLIDDTNYGAPFDYYVIQKCETDFNFKMYWTSTTYFHQSSNLGKDSTTIQLAENITPLRLILFYPGHEKNTKALDRMCESAGMIIETAWDPARLQRNDYAIVIMNFHYIPPEFFPPHVKIIYGPQHWVFPQGELCGPLNKSYDGRAVYNNLAPWNIEVFNSFSPLRVRHVQFPFAVDLQKFKPASVPKSLDCIIYFKRRNPSELELVQAACSQRGLNFKIFKYGFYVEDDYLHSLQSAKFMIVLDAHESQGFALGEAMSCNVPLLVCDAITMHQETDDGVKFTYDNLKHLPLRATSVPYWDDTLCGIKITNLCDFDAALDQMRETYCTFNPRAFIERDLGPLPCMLRILEYFNL